MSEPNLSLGSYSPTDTELFTPTEEHEMLRAMVAEFTVDHVEPQAEEFDEKECLNIPLFRKLGELGLLGITIPAEDGGAGMDTTAAVIAHEGHQVSACKIACRIVEEHILGARITTVNSP